MNTISKEDLFLALSACPYLHHEDAWLLLKLPVQVLQSTSNSLLLQKYCLNKNSFSLIKEWLLKFEINKFKERLSTEKIGVINGNSSLYPLLLKETHSPPPFIFYKGNKNLFNCSENSFCLAVVGSRKNTAYGKRALENILGTLCKLESVVIISGLARGIDTLAHETALSNNCPTIAVLGSGIFHNSVYPPENRKLSNDIVNKNGLVLSEFPPNSPPQKDNFPRRNRIIAGLSKATLVVEAAERSGALITARFALENNREVFAIPSNIFYPSAKGVNKLIQKGAYPIICAEDIISYFF